MEGQIENEVSDERLQQLQTLLVDQQTAFNAATLGRTTDILLEREGKLPGQLIGKSPWLQSVHLVAPGLNIGDIVTVAITESGPMSLKGEMLMKVAA